MISKKQIYKVSSLLFSSLVGLFVTPTAFLLMSNGGWTPLISATVGVFFGCYISSVLMGILMQKDETEEKNFNLSIF